MNLVFIPNYLYLSMPLFEQIIDKLDDKANIKVINLPGTMRNNLSDVKGLKYFKNNQAQFINTNIIQIDPGKKIIFFQIFKLIRIIGKNYFTIKALFKETKPDLVVVGSDLGNVNIRFFIGFCLSQQIPIIILFNTDLSFSKNNHKLFGGFVYNLIFKLFYRKGSFIFWRGLLFKGKIPGSYAFTAPIYLSSENIANKYIKLGINPNRIKIINMFNTNSIAVNDLTKKEKLKNELLIPDGYKVITFFTECIHHVYGERYAIEMYKKIKGIFDGLVNTVVLIKIHPLETIYDTIKDIFTGRNYIILKTYNAEDIIALSDLSIAHFSRVLISAAVLHAKFLSINWLNDREKTFILPEESDIVEAKSPEMLAQKIRDVFENQEFCQELLNAISGIAKRFITKDGDIDLLVSQILSSQH